MAHHEFTPETVRREFGVHRRLVLLGAGATVASLFLPWLTVEFGGSIATSVSGLDLIGTGSLPFNGVVTVGFAVTAAGLCFQRAWTRRTQRHVALLGCAVAAIGLVLLVSPEAAVAPIGSSGGLATALGAGTGVHLTVAGGAVIAGAGFHATPADGVAAADDDRSGSTTATGASDSDTVGGSSFRR